MPLSNRNCKNNNNQFIYLDNAKATELLLQNGLNVNDVDDENSPPLHTACFYGKLKIFTPNSNGVEMNLFS